MTRTTDTTDTTVLTYAIHRIRQGSAEYVAQYPTISDCEEWLRASYHSPYIRIEPTPLDINQTVPMSPENVYQYPEFVISPATRALPIPMIPGYSVVHLTSRYDAYAPKTPIATLDSHDAALRYAMDYVQTCEIPVGYRGIPCAVGIVPDYQYPGTPRWTHTVTPSASRLLNSYPVFSDDAWNVLRSTRETSRVVAEIWDTAMSARRTVDNVLGIDIQFHPDGSVSYLPNTRAVVVSSEYPIGYVRHASGRVSGKLVKTLRKLFPTVQATDSQWEIIGNTVKSLTTVPEDFPQVRGYDIPRLYASDAKSPLASWSSCMTNDVCTTERWLALYAENPTVCSMLIHTDPDGKLLARALVWETTDGKTVLDRVYGSDVLRQAFHAYATRQGWTIGYDHGHAYSGSVQLNAWDFDAYPYLDSFMYLDMASGELSTYEPSGHYRTLQSTCGDYDEHIQTYRVVLTRTVTETAYLDIEATSEDEAQAIAETYGNYQISRYSIGTDFEEDWTVDYVELSD